MAGAARQLIEEAYAVRRAGNPALALGLYQQAATAAADDPATRAHCLRHIGDLEREAGRLPQAREALGEAEALYRATAADTLALANTVRLRALTEGDAALWQEARALYAEAERETGLDLSAAFKECDAHLER
jgi:hypothetical protein